VHEKIADFEVVVANITAVFLPTLQQFSHRFDCQLLNLKSNWTY